MSVSISGSIRSFLSPIAAIILFALSLQAQSTATLRGKVVDPLGKIVPNAKLVLLQDDKELFEGRSDADGSFSLSAPNPGRYTLRVEAAAEVHTSSTVPRPARWECNARWRERPNSSVQLFLYEREKL